MRVGELARETGLTVRTLHHYDEIGLLSPSRRSEAGYRLYGRDDVARLQQIRSLRQLGFPLDEIRSLLDGADLSPLKVIELHLQRLREGIALQQKLVERLEELAARLAADEQPRQADLVRAIEVMSMTEQVHKYYTPEQLAALEQRRNELGEEGMARAEGEWAALIEEVRQERDAGTDPTDPRMQELARRWRRLIEQFTGGDAGIQRSMVTMYETEGPDRASRGAVDPELMAYVGKALEAIK